ncbi:MAG TPA: phenylalanine--tRNA ligase subunit beta [Bryobacteraceae bacterium]|nr:phenylalanine--tRNA ligase subunit beta [Bryobacteraceae bacterium]
MKFSYNWLRELVPGLDQDAHELSKLITMKTAESEGVEPHGEFLSEIRAARVLRAEPIDGSKNRKAVVDVGELGQRTVVCGAPNCREGMLTAYVPSGVRLGDKQILRATISGVESDGMLASGDELGLNRDSEGILDLDHDLQPGQQLGLDPDFLIEIDNKSLTHRPDLWGHYGMAREIAAITKHKLLDPVTEPVPPVDPVYKIDIRDPALCPRYSALVFENVTVQPSPLWLQYRLQAIGLNPINNIVDVTNYVMAELAQPMHAFDADKLQGDTIFVRRATERESFEALNQETYELSPSNLVIADASGAIALAGVIGGGPSAISSGTTRILLESANFNASSIRKTSAEFRLRTDASMRFEKAQDPENTVRGLARAIGLLREVSPGIRLVGGLADAYYPLPVVPPITLDLDWLNRKLGREVPESEVREILESLEFKVESPSPRTFVVSVPSWRATKDISMRDDLVEEIGRMIGYSSITPQAPLQPVRVPPPNPERDFHHRVRELATDLGFTEVYNYSFLSTATAEAFGLNPDEHVRLENPIAEGQDLMRSTLVPGIVANLRENSKYLDEFRLFEIGRAIHRRPQGQPTEINRLDAAIFRKGDDASGFYELKRLAEALHTSVALRPGTALRYQHPARTADVLLGNKVLGQLFEVHPEFLESGRGTILDLDLDTLLAQQPTTKMYKSLQRFPSSAFDLSVVSGERELVGDIQAALLRFATAEVESVEFVRVYSGPPLPKGQKSVSYRVTVAAPDRTLSSDEVSAMRQRMIDGMRSLGYELRV